MNTDGNAVSIMFVLLWGKYCTHSECLLFSCFMDISMTANTQGKIKSHSESEQHLIM